MLALYLAFFLTWPPTGGDIMYITLSLISIIVIFHETRRIWTLRPFQSLGGLER
jgi:hypothetical protein